MDSQKRQWTFSAYSNLKKILASVGAACAAVIIIFVLFYPPMPGVADQGDFQRVMSVTGLENISEDRDHWFRYVTTKYKMISLDKVRLRGDLVTTSMIYPIEAAREISKLIGNEYFSTKILAGVYAAMYVFSIYACLRLLKLNKISTSIFFTVLSIVILADGNYLIWFNSLYGEAMAIISLLLFTASVLYALHNMNKLNLLNILFLFISAYLFLGAKLQCFSALPLIALLIIRIALLSNRRMYIHRMINASTAVALILVLTFYVKGIYNNVNSRSGVDTMYNSVFYGILKESKNPGKDLETLGLSLDMAVDAGKHAYLPREEYVRYAPWSQRTISELNNKMNNFKLLKFYLFQPHRLIKGMEYTASKCFDTMGTLGKYEKSTVNTYTYTFKRFTLWSYLRSSVLPKSLIFIVSFYLAIFAVSTIEYRKNKNRRIMKLRIELLWTIMMIGLLQFPMPFIGNGEADTAKQLFIFNYTFDITILCAATWIFDKVNYHVFSK